MKFTTSLHMQKTEHINEEEELRVSSDPGAESTENRKNKTSNFACEKPQTETQTLLGFIHIYIKVLSHRLLQNKT